MSNIKSTNQDYELINSKISCPFMGNINCSINIQDPSKKKINFFTNIYRIINNFGLMWLGKFWVPQYFGAIYPFVISHKRGEINGFKTQFYTETVINGLQSSEFFKKYGIYELAKNNGGICTFWLGSLPAIYLARNLPITHDNNLSPSTSENQGLFGEFMGTYKHKDSKRKKKRQPLVSTLGNLTFVKSLKSEIQYYFKEYINKNINSEMYLEDFTLRLTAFIDSNLSGIVDLKQKTLEYFLINSEYKEIVKDFFNIASDVISKMNKEASASAESIVPFIRDLLLSNYDSILEGPKSNIIKNYFEIWGKNFTLEEINKLDDKLLKELGTIIIALYDTTSLSLYWVISFIENNPKIKNSIITSSNKKNYDPDKLDYIDLIILEAIRVAGSNPTALWRKVDIPFSIKKNNKLLFIRSGTMIWLDRCLSNKDENIFPNPKEFDPENIKAVLKSNNENISSVLGHNRYEINSFSMVNTINNPRKCPGRVFSVFMQSLLIRELYSNYKIKSKKISVRFRKYNSMPAPEAGALITINKN